MTYEEILDKWIRKIGRPCTAGEIVHDLRQLEQPGSVKGFADAMREIAKQAEDDEERSHAIADGLMCDLLRELGYGEGIDIFESMPKWYA